MFVSASNGLEVRESPSLNSSLLSIIPYGEDVWVNSRTTNRYTINGKNDYWYEIMPEHVEDNRWVFGGALIESFESEPFVGFWTVEGDRYFRWIFRIDESFTIRNVYTGYSGYFDLRENNILLLNYDTFISYNGFAHQTPYTNIKEARIIFMNINQMQLIFEEEIIILNRSNNL